ncbi:hypothetical protein MPDQ_000985 [Monascus purpureus]|uniref:Uncharacterized protein n=1 Tax=Monascus purpureus TaxID=5098 RepID=A0A507QS64_MONPU|nr:hypothetical protein MPDQ_000985 [Monascus purpureus]BDD60976.1 hypothetical protein MAP00_006062 [Monascus purpureus]
MERKSIKVEEQPRNALDLWQYADPPGLETIQALENGRHGGVAPLSMARSNSLISNAAVALSQLHLAKFSSTTERHRAPHVTRNGQHLARYLCIFAKDSLSDRSDVPKEAFG